MKRHRLRRRYGRAKPSSGSIRSYAVTSGPSGPSAIAYDAAGRVVNVINGERNDNEYIVRRAARRHWPGAKER